MAEHNKIGKIGEDTACKFLKQHKMKIIDRNYRKKWGELDIVAWHRKSKTLRFVEVKSVSYENLDEVSPETEVTGPEQKIDDRKKGRIRRAIQTYIAENKLENVEWRMDVLVIFLNIRRREGKVKVLWDVII